MVVKAPAGLTTSGCGYAVSLRRDPESALALLERSRIPYGKVFLKTQDGEYREVDR